VKGANTQKWLRCFTCTLVGNENGEQVRILVPLLLGISQLSSIGFSEVDEPLLVGAIRWDAWYGDGKVVRAVEASLGQPKYHFRLPWFAQLVGDDKVRINGDSQAIVEQEISYAAQSGLNYWAFIDYWNDVPSMQIALTRFKSAQNKKGIRYCLIEEGGRLDERGITAWSRLVENFQHPDYQTVLGGRPLLFVYIKPTKLEKSDWDELRRQTTAAGLNNPYLVLMGWNLKETAKDMEELGFDAVSAYAAGGSYSWDQPSYDRQCQLLRKGLWQRWRELQVPCITLASAGWDTRPRMERPPFWINDINIQPVPDPTPFAEQKPLTDSVTATPVELAAHIREAVVWTKENRDINITNSVLIYAWNEHDEGGWLQPTLGLDGLPNEERIRALRSVLHPSSKESSPSKP